MHVLLINISRQTDARIPQGLFYLGSAAHAAGHKVTIHDEALVANPQESLEQVLSCDADIIGMSVYSLPWQLKRVEDISRRIKSARKSTLVIWGGWHTTLYPRHSILNEDVDIVVRGPGEKPLCRLLDALQQGYPLKNIPGLVLNEKGRIIETGAECLEPEYLYPALHPELIKFNAYLEDHGQGAGILRYIASRGCHAKCRFCVMSRLFQGRLIRKPRDQVVGELRHMLQNYKVNAIHFADDNTFRADSDALELCAIISEVTNGRGIPWRCATRIDTLSRLANETFEKLTASGYRGVVVGIESGVDRVLRLMGKHITVPQIQKTLKSLVNNRLKKNLFCFLLNFTAETKTEAVETLRLACKTRLMLPESDINLNVYFPGASDTDWLPSDPPSSLAPRLSQIFADYYAKHVTNYRIGGAHIRILRYYFGASKSRQEGQLHKAGPLRRIYRRLILLRIKYGFFALPFEYYLSNIVIKRIRRILTRIKSNRYGASSREKRSVF